MSKRQLMLREPIFPMMPRGSQTGRPQVWLCTDCLPGPPVSGRVVEVVVQEKDIYMNRFRALKKPGAHTPVRLHMEV